MSSPEVDQLSVLSRLLCEALAFELQSQRIEPLNSGKAFEVLHFRKVPIPYDRSGRFRSLTPCDGHSIVRAWLPPLTTAMCW